MHVQGRGQGTVNARRGRASLVPGIDGAPELACNAVGEASEKGRVHDTVQEVAKFQKLDALLQPSETLPQVR
jgi:hypothetical protein